MWVVHTFHEKIPFAQCSPLDPELHPGSIGLVNGFVFFVERVLPDGVSFSGR